MASSIIKFYIAGETDISMKKSKTKKYVITAVIIIALLTAIILPLAVNLSKKKETEVRVGTASKGDIISYLTLTAAIEPQKQQNIYALSQLKVLDIHVEVGDTVKKGDVLLTFDVSAYTKAVDNAKKAVDETESELNAATAEIKALSSSTDPTKLALISQKQSALASIQSAYSQAKSAYEQAKSVKDAVKSEYTADFDGIVSVVNIEKGAMTASIATQPAITVIDNKNLKAVISASRYDVDKIQVGQPVSIIYNGKSYTGKLSKKAPTASKVLTANGSEAQLECTVDITGDSAGLIIGFDADAQIKTAESKNIIKVPVESVNKEKSNYYVYIVKGDNTLEKRDVTIGIQSDSETEIKSGIAEGELVVLNPDNSLSNGKKVKVKD